jgi:hypothetical protein
VVVSFSSLGQIPEKNDLKEGKIYFLAHGFRGFSLRSAGSLVSGSMVRQSIMAERHVGVELLTSWQSGSGRE